MMNKTQREVLRRLLAAEVTAKQKREEVREHEAEGEKLRTKASEAEDALREAMTRARGERLFEQLH